MLMRISPATPRHYHKELLTTEAEYNGEKQYVLTYCMRCQRYQTKPHNDRSRPTVTQTKRPRVTQPLRRLATSHPNRARQHATQI